MFPKLPNGLSYRLSAGVTGVDSATTGNILLKMSSENNPSLLVPGAHYVSDSALLSMGQGHGQKTHALAIPPTCACARARACVCVVQMHMEAREVS